MLEVVRAAEDLADFFHCKDLWKFSGNSADAVGDGYLIFGHVFVKKAKSGKNAVAAVRCIAFVLFKIEKIILDLFFGYLVRGLVIKPGDSCDSVQIRPLGVMGEVLSSMALIIFVRNSVMSYLLCFGLITIWRYFTRSG